MSAKYVIVLSSPLPFLMSGNRLLNGGPCFYTTVRQNVLALELPCPFWLVKLNLQLLQCNRWVFSMSMVIPRYWPSGALILIQLSSMVTYIKKKEVITERINIPKYKSIFNRLLVYLISPPPLQNIWRGIQLWPVQLFLTLPARYVHGFLSACH